MIALFTGGSGSGKSEMAESFACRRAEGGKLYYFATMRVWGEEGRARVEKHRRQREGKGFETIECPDRLPRGIAGGVILLECLSNRLANAMFGENEPDPVGVFYREIDALGARERSRRRYERDFLRPRRNTTRKRRNILKIWGF